jgi:hypothetical protein
MSKNSKQYFGEKEDKAVNDFINSDSLEERNFIYNKILAEPFRKMIQSIIRVYPIHIGNYTMEEVESDVLVHLIDKMDKYVPDTITKSGNKTKAFSYCQTIVRNYLRDHGKNTYKEKKNNVNYDDYVSDFSNNTDYSYELDYDKFSDTTDTLEVFINAIINNIENKLNDENSFLKKNEIIVGDAIINILKNWKVLFLEDTPIGKYEKKVTNKFQKNKILFFIKEQTNLNTTDIRAATKCFKELYLFEKEKHISK